MPPKRRDRGDAAPGPKPPRGVAKETIDYPRPFFNRCLTKAEIQEDLALIQSSLKREHRAPARYGAPASAYQDAGNSQQGAAGGGGRGAGSSRQMQQQQQQHPAAAGGIPVGGMPHGGYMAPGTYAHPGMRGATPTVVYHTVQPVQVHQRYVVGS